MKALVLVLMLSVFSLLPAGNVEIQKRRLKYVQQMIEEKLAELSETQQNREDVKHQLTIYRQRTEKFMTMIQNLTAKENELVMQIIDRTNRRDIIENELAELTKHCNHKVECFYANILVETDPSKRAIKEKYLPLIINAGSNKIDLQRSLLTETEESLEQDRIERRTIESERSVRELSSRSLQREISNLYSLVESITAQEQAHLAKVQQLERNRIALETLIEQIQSEKEKFSFKFTNDKLLWPVNGQVESKFGEAYDETTKLTLINNGITITADEQQQVKAVDFGKVVFAESFRSYGRMIVIDHLNGYFSLYAGNSSLLAAKGDDVDLGEPIAVTGKNNSSEDKYSLHFEIRRRSKAVDPLLYLE